jgi:hypothetical protein
VKARLVAAIGVAFVVGLATFYFTRPGSVSEHPPGGGGATGAPGVAAPIRSGEAQTILAPDAIQGIDEPRFLTPDKARFVPATAAVIGVSIGGEAHAYLIGLLSRHEIVNDRVGGRNIAVTW